MDEDAGSTCTECEEEELNLLAFWKQLNEVKLEGNHGNAVLRGQGFSCTHRQPIYYLLYLSSIAFFHSYPSL